MKKRILCLALAAGLLALPLGCATINGSGVVVPPQCEGALLYQVPGFLPLGPMTIRAGTALALFVKPEIKPAVALAAKIGYEVVKAGGLAGGITALANILEPLQEYGPAISVAAVTLEELLRYAGQETVLHQCDKDVLLSLFVNIGLDAGVDVRTGGLPSVDF